MRLDGDLFRVGSASRSNWGSEKMFSFWTKTIMLFCPDVKCHPLVGRGWGQGRFLLLPSVHNSAIANKSAISLSSPHLRHGCLNVFLFNEPVKFIMMWTMFSTQCQTIHNLYKRVVEWCITQTKLWKHFNRDCDPICCIFAWAFHARGINVKFAHGFGLFTCIEYYVFILLNGSLSLRRSQILLRVLLCARKKQCTHTTTRHKGRKKRNHFHLFVSNF